MKGLKHKREKRELLFQHQNIVSGQRGEKEANLNCIKILNFCALKDTINRVKRQPMKWEKIYANHKTNTGLILKK